MIIFFPVKPSFSSNDRECLYTSVGIRIPWALVEINADFRPWTRDADPGHPRTTPGETPPPTELEQGPQGDRILYAAAATPGI